MFRQLVLKPVTDTAQPAMTELRNFAKKAADSYTTIPHVVLQFHSYCQQLYVTHPKPTNSDS